MFTGLIEEIGKLRAVRRQGETLVLDIAASRILDDIKLGDSIAVNGVCLTVISHDSNSFSADVTPQTYRHSNLSELKPGSPVNLERAMVAGGRFGGHIVQGHADGTGTIRGKKPEANAIYFTIEPNEPRLLRTIVPQGSVALDGISLTVADVDRTAGTFTVSLIPHTLKETVLQYKQTGDTVNIENDILGKYVEHLLGMREQAAAPPRKGLTAALLRENGFIL
jgi:riboflavin synthase